MISSLFVQHTPVPSSFWSLRSPFLMLLVCCVSSRFRQYKACHRPCAQYFPALWSDCPCWHLSLEGRKSFFFLLSASSSCTVSIFRIKSIFAHTAVSPCPKAQRKVFRVTHQSFQKTRIDTMAHHHLQSLPLLIVWQKVSPAHSGFFLGGVWGECRCCDGSSRTYRKWG